MCLAAMSSLLFLKVFTTSETSLSCSTVGATSFFFSCAFFSSILFDFSVSGLTLTGSELTHSDPVSTKTKTKLLCGLALLREGNLLLYMQYGS